MFAHTSLESGLWRGWFNDGQSLEFSWPSWSVGIRFMAQAGDSGADRLLWLSLLLFQAFVPLGRTRNEWPIGDEPQWGFQFSGEFGIVLYWGEWRRHFEWPFHTILVDSSYMTEGGWRSTDSVKYEPGKAYVRRPSGAFETHPYTYKLRSGEIQYRNATILKERWIRGRHILDWLGWPRRVSYAIDVEFDGEVGERTGSWKGGCIGCGYTMLPGETPLDTLRRMERERTF